MLPFIKLYLGNGPGAEIRKMPSYGGRQPYPWLFEKLKTIFPQLADKKFSIQWKDEQDDFIIVNTTEELYVAMEDMEKMNQKCYIIYIKLDEDEKKQPTAPENERNTTSEPVMNSYKTIEHPGVICDICNEQIHGFRYKCMECDNYDVCSNCEAKGCHFQHCMVRLPYPTQITSHMLHYFKKFAKKIDYFGEKNSSTRHSHTKRAKNGGACSYKRNMGTREQSAKCPLDPEMQSKSKEPKDDIPNKTQTAGDEHSSESDSDEQTKCPFDITSNTKPVEDLIETLLPGGASRTLISVVLNKFLGIPTETEAETSTSNKKLNTEGDCKKQAAPGKKVSCDTAPEPEKQNKNEEPQEKITVAKNTHEPRVNFSDCTTTPTANTENQQITESTNIDNNEKTETMEEWTIIDKNERLPHHRNTPSPAKEVTVNTPVEETVTQPSAPVEWQLYPSLSEGNTVYHANPKIQTAVEKMISMGYSNIGGVLTYLLDAEDGNIATVLDKLERMDTGLG